jgi:hypothetical protein
MAGPKDSNPGPIFPRQAAAAEKLEMKLNPSSVSRRNPALRRKRYVKIKFVI